jgi:hypothetical protein
MQRTGEGRFERAQAIAEWRPKTVVLDVWHKAGIRYPRARRINTRLAALKKLRLRPKDLGCFAEIPLSMRCDESARHRGKAKPDRRMFDFHHAPASFS